MSTPKASTTTDVYTTGYTEKELADRISFVASTRGWATPQSASVAFHGCEVTGYRVTVTVEKIEPQAAATAAKDAE